MQGAGPKSKPVEGRHGNSFTHFGDYSVDLFRHAQMHDKPPYRALFDMVAVAIVKNPSLGEANEIPAPILVEEKWKKRPENSRKVVIWENFQGKAILDDFFATMHMPVLAERSE